MLLPPRAEVSSSWLCIHRVTSPGLARKPQERNHFALLAALDECASLRKGLQAPNPPSLLSLLVQRPQGETRVFSQWKRTQRGVLETSCCIGHTENLPDATILSQLPVHLGLGLTHLESRSFRKTH